MCGIAGKIFYDREQTVDPGLIDRMTDRLAHRGPDARGTFVDGGVGLGHRRLSIIDLSSAANQPMVGPSGAVLTFNGEIYNFAELRAGLERGGRAFRTRSDTEVILALYEERGDACVEALHGMFAFAIWDPRRRRLFCARDRLGKKPFYYHAGPRGFAFASEIDALLADPEIPTAVDPAALHDYLVLHYVPSPDTAFRDIRKIPPAHTLVVEDGKLTVSRYWRARFEPKLAGPVRDLEEEAWSLITEATRARLVSDVPLGAFLSGGTDSSAVVAAMCQITGRRVKTFSIGFREAAFNELEDAARTARRYDTEHHEFLVTSDAAEVLPQLVAHHGEPFADPSSVPTYYLARLARAHVTVALSGDGGDEAFGGYTRYVWARLAAELFDQIPAPVLRGAAAALAWLGRRRRAPWKLRVAGQHAPVLWCGDEARYLALAGHFAPWERAEIYTPDFTNAVAAAHRRDTVEWFARSHEAGDARHRLDRYIQNDLDGYLSDGIMVKVDIASMIHALEVRAPLLDHRLIEFGARLPVVLKQRGFSKRVLYKRAVRRHLPAETLRRPKRGLGIPVGAWLRGTLRPMLEDLVAGPRLAGRGLFDPSRLRELVANHLAGRGEYGHRLWNLMVLELWMRRFIDRSDRNADRSGDVPARSAAA
jgi:asparagine synthase (glutamine-hydrolysing)